MLFTPKTDFRFCELHHRGWLPRQLACLAIAGAIFLCLWLKPALVTGALGRPGSRLELQGARCWCQKAPGRFSIVPIEIICPCGVTGMRECRIAYRR